MKVVRSSKLSLKFLSPSKRSRLNALVAEHGRVVNLYLAAMQNIPELPRKVDKDTKNLISDTWLTETYRYNAATEAKGMLKAERAAAKEASRTPSLPTHNGKRMVLARVGTKKLLPAAKAKSFDLWLAIMAQPRHQSFAIPLKRHRQFNKLAARSGARQMTGIEVNLRQNCVKISFEVDTGKKLTVSSAIGIDTGIKSLATTTDGRQLGGAGEFEKLLERVLRRKHGGHGQHRARVAVKQFIAKTAKEVVQGADLIVVENLKGITKNTNKPKRRLGKKMRRLVGAWCVSEWLMRVQQRCDDNRIVFRAVPARNTSRKCLRCNLIDQRSRRSQSVFKCVGCGFTEHADLIAARNILMYFLTSKYVEGVVSPSVVRALLTANHLVGGCQLRCSNSIGQPGEIPAKNDS